MLIVAAEGDRAQGIGTPFAIILILTIPGGALLGAYAGAHRAATGGWKGILSASQRDGAPHVERFRATRKSVTLLNRELGALGEDEARHAKQQYLKDLKDELEDTKLNHRLVIVTGLIGLLFTPLLIWPLYLIGLHFWTKYELQSEILKVEALGASGSAY
jgi:hypothetical protein